MPIAVDDIGSVIRLTIRTDAGVIENISAASPRTIKLRKPDGTVLSKAGIMPGSGTDGILAYTTLAGDIDQPGIWTAQAYLVIGGWSGHSTPRTFEVIEHF